MPARAPKPTALTNRIATITGWKERHTTITARAGQPGGKALLFEPVLATVDLLEVLLGDAQRRAVVHHPASGHADDAVREAPRQLDVVDIDDHREAVRLRQGLHQAHDLDRSL